MSEAFFAEMGVRIRDLCALNWTNVNLIADHGHCAVNRPRLGREAYNAMETAAGIFRDLGPERLPGAAGELYRAGLIALSTIEPILQWRYDESEAERPEELQTAQILLNSPPSWFALMRSAMSRFASLKALSGNMTTGRTACHRTSVVQSWTRAISTRRSATIASERPLHLYFAGLPAARYRWEASQVSYLMREHRQGPVWIPGAMANH